LDTNEPLSTEVTAKPLPRSVQLILLGIIGAALVVVLFIVPAIFHAASSSTPAAAEAPVASDGSFKPSAQQWAGLKGEAAKQVHLRIGASAEGKIAVDDDLVTPIYSPFSGRVTRLMAKAGDTLRQGDPLFAVQASEFAQGQSDLIAAAAALKIARAQLNLADTNESRQHKLYLAQGGALKDWQQSQVDLATAQGGVHSAESALSAVRNRLRILGKTDAQISQLEAGANLANMPADAVVYAPIGGTVTQRQIGLGQNIVSASAGAANPVFSIADLSKVWLVANARETDAPRIHLNDPVDVSVLAYPGRVFAARITYVGSSIDPNTHRLPVRAEVENPDGALKPEMFATFNIITDDDRASLAIPEAAIVYEGETAHVWMMNTAKQTLASREVRVGRVADGVAEILQGLQPGETVVTSGGVFIDRAVLAD
jgi:cobalt-zinc-cadmium efflux system membrane fusion protein